jgi:transcriptional regulator with XRE-family HTH domain
MPGSKRPAARIAGEDRARQAASRAGADVRASRRARRWTQAHLAARIGISRAKVAKLELGRGAGTPSGTWFALGEALGRPYRAEFLRDTFAEPPGAGHLDIQELVLRVGKGAGYEGRFELATRPTDPARSSDAVLLDRRRRRMVLVECWNTFGDLGAAARSSDRKLAEAAALAVALGGDGPTLTVGLCWVVRDTAANRALIARYEHIFAARFPGSSGAWVMALTMAGPMPAQPGLVWCDLRATRLVARRRRGPGR